MKTKKPKEPLLFDITKLDFKYNLNAEYEAVEAADHAERCKNDYCRCTTLENKRIEGNPFYPVFNKILDKYNSWFGINNPITEFCIERLCSIHKIQEPENYDIESVGGYYGEELGPIYLCNALELQEDLIKLSRFSDDKSKIEFILLKEYGYILDDLKDCSYKLERIDRDKIELNRDYYKKVSPIPDFEESQRPLGIVLKQRKQGTIKFRLIDGYNHFCSSARQKGLLFIVAY